MPTDVNLQRCQRYYYLHATGNNQTVSEIQYRSNTQIEAVISFPTTMRAAPSLEAADGTDYYNISIASGNDTFNNFTIFNPSTTNTMIYNASQVSGTEGKSFVCFTNNSASEVAFNSEL